MQKKIFLIGTGPMATDYAKVLNAQNQKYTVIGRGETSAKMFKEATGVNPILGGIEKYLEKQALPVNSYVIIATGTEALMPAMLSVLSGGAEKVLVEKPAAISIEELLENEEKLRPYISKVFVAYNRRFYASTLEAKRLIEEDGGLQSMHFEFTEWAHIIGPLQKAHGVKENWFFANSTHVVDLAFFLAGNPLEWKTYSKKGKITWHEKTNFSGAGITEKGVMFSYISNWESAGRWGIELLTKKRRIYLKPLEGVAVQTKGTIAIVDHTFNDTSDKEFKPGIYKQTEAFFGKNKSNLISLKSHIENSKRIYSIILNE